MPSKNPDVIKRARDKWYANNSQRQMDRQKIRRRALKDGLLEYKKTLSCADCGVSFSEHPEWLDFHHTDPSKKEGIVSAMTVSSEKKMLAEIEKCIPLCSNCHRTRHRG